MKCYFCVSYSQTLIGEYCHKWSYTVLIKQSSMHLCCLTLSSICKWNNNIDKFQPFPSVLIFNLCFLIPTRAFIISIKCIVYCQKSALSLTYIPYNSTKASTHFVIRMYCSHVQRRYVVTWVTEERTNYCTHSRGARQLSMQSNLTQLTESCGKRCCHVGRHQVESAATLENVTTPTDKRCVCSVATAPRL
jgi:hypothetical protein